MLGDDTSVIFYAYSCTLSKACIKLVVLLEGSVEYRSVSCRYVWSALFIHRDNNVEMCGNASDNV